MKAAIRFAERVLSIPADLARLREAREFAAEAAAAYGFDDRVQYQIKMAASEAVANAVEHGSASPGDQIELRVRDERGSLAFYVSDRGSFVSKLPARGALPERGRGLAFMAQLMDEVDLRPGPDGTVIRFSKRRGHP